MARARLLKPGFFTNADLAMMPPHARLLFAGLWTIADRDGRLKDDPPTIKGALFPHEVVDVAELLQTLAKKRFILRYRVQGRAYIAIPTWKAHQSPHVKEAPSQIPEPPGRHRASTVLAPDKPHARPAFSGASPAVPIAVTDPDPVAVTRAALGWPGEDEDGPNSFRQRYRIGYEQQTGKPITPNRMLVAGQLEREYGSPRCVEVAEACGWDKHPNYYRGPLEDINRERNNGARTTSGRGPTDEDLRAAEHAATGAGRLPPFELDPYGAGNGP